jgi:hypothetical protein
MADMLATPTDLASALQRDVDTASATLALEIATALVQIAAGGQRIVLSTSTNEVVYGGPDRVLRLPQQPVVSVASVTYDGSLLTQGTASGTWRLAKYGIWRDLGWAPYSWQGPTQVTVTYTHGYAPGAQELQLGRGFALSLARGLFTNPDGTIREQIDDYAVAYAEASAALEASPAMKALLRKQYGPKARMVSVF